MKKNLIIVLLTLTTAFSMFYAHIKANQATQAAAQIQDIKKLAEEQKMEAERQVEMSMMSAAEAKRQEAIAMNLQAQLDECQSK